MPNSAVGFSTHNHAQCVKTALVAAQSVCADRGVQMTPTRLRVLEILLEEHVAMGAYDVLARLSDEGLGSKPPVAYRALGFLVDQGFAHRIERLNAFVACTHPNDAHNPAFMICRQCGTVAEAQAQAGAFGHSIEETGFQIEQTVIEAEGLCPTCQTGAAQ